jgi:hypothetical protein
MLLAAGLPVLTATGAVLLRAAIRPQDRGAWLALGLALAFQATGAIWLAVPGGGPRFPVGADFALLAFFPAALVAAVLFARTRLARFGPVLWLDTANHGCRRLPLMGQAQLAVVEEPQGGRGPLQDIGVELFGLRDIAVPCGLRPGRAVVGVVDGGHRVVRQATAVLVDVDLAGQ